MLKLVYKGEELLGEVEVYPEELNNKKILDELKDIRISHFSQSSERCPPVAVLHTISSNGVCFKMESKSSSSSSVQDTSPLFLLHSSCIMENKTAVMALGGLFRLCV
ncbi:RNA polymerase II C-terminal domain phosphatase-like 1 [Rosa rugosa]|uniref:RNA polymerase II C-terminal domain phosphatase-like 1 n=1 Tax=Rosa rugosa TaxID=74645 RepID=UPI002B402FFE|nr:RNA polymerase II C-terminal domain phosphatase-like 1 [Rosa rugosa]